eukprot:407971-Rhodomonas_salina.4
MLIRNVAVLRVDALIASLQTWGSTIVADHLKYSFTVPRPLHGFEVAPSSQVHQTHKVRSDRPNVAMLVLPLLLVSMANRGNKGSLPGG